MATMVEEVGQSLTQCDEPVGGSKEERIPEPCIVVIFGASGDLTKRKLLPALFHLQQQHLLPKDFVVVGVARRDLSATFATDMQEGILKGGGVDGGDSALKPFMDRVKYFSTEFDSDEGFDKLKAYLAELDQQYGTKGNRLFYLAVAPEYFADIAERLAKHGMTQAKEKGQWINVIIEKPFGTDLESARKLNDELNQVLDEHQIFRIDHYLGKETVQNILVFRFGNGIFEPIWNRNYVDYVEITAAESIGIEGRGPFYEKAGALRDVLQNHVMEVLSFVAMEPPDSFDAQAVRTEKLKVWRAIDPIPVDRHGARSVWSGRYRWTAGHWLSAGGPGRSAVDDGDLCRDEAEHRELALGRRSVLYSRRQAAAYARNGSYGHLQAGSAASVQDEQHEQPGVPERAEDSHSA